MPCFNLVQVHNFCTWPREKECKFQSDGSWGNWNALENTYPQEWRPGRHHLQPWCKFTEGTLVLNPDSEFKHVVTKILQHFVHPQPTLFTIKANQSFLLWRRPQYLHIFFVFTWPFRHAADSSLIFMAAVWHLILKQMDSDGNSRGLSPKKLWTFLRKGKLSRPCHCGSHQVSGHDLCTSRTDMDMYSQTGQSLHHPCKQTNRRWCTGVLPGSRRNWKHIFVVLRTTNARYPGDNFGGGE